MNRTAGIGAALTALGLVGYVVGVVAAYPGRSFSVTAVMIGLAMLLIGRSIDPEAMVA